MNILHTECGLNWGGQEYRTLIESRWLNQNGHRAWIACDPRSEIYRRGQEMQASVLPVPMRSNADLTGLGILWSLCKQHQIDIIHTHGPKDSWMCVPLRIAGYPVVRSRHITVPIKPGLQHSFVYRYGCDRIIATAEVIRETLIRHNRIEPSKIDVVGEGVDLLEYRRDLDGTPFRKEWNIPNDAPFIGIIAMMRGDKGHDYFLAAALETLKSHPKARFALIGEGIGGRRIEKECRQRIAEAGEEARIVMTGYRADIPNVMAALDIVVVASVAVEAQSRIVPQAFAMAKAVVATNVGGIPELVQHQINGILVPPANSSAIAQAILKLIEAPPLRNRLSEAGHAFAQKHLSLEQMMLKTLTSYQMTMAKNLPYRQSKAV